MRRHLAQYPLALVGAVVALVAAAVLVFSLQRRLVAQHQATLQQVCEQTANNVARTVRRLLRAPVMEVLRPLRQRELINDFSRVAYYFGMESSRQTYVDGFFLWHESFPERFDEEVLFFEPTGGEGDNRILLSDATGQWQAAPAPVSQSALVMDPERGDALFRLGTRLSNATAEYAVANHAIHGHPYQVVYHYYWSSRTELLAMAGFLVDLATIDQRIADLIATSDAVATPAAPLRLTVVNELGDVIVGVPALEGAPSATVSVDMLFSPSARQELPAPPPERPWVITVSADAPRTAWLGTESWAAAAAVLMIVIALFCAVLATRQVAQLSRLQAEFVVNVSHQLKTPLSVLSGVSETLRDGRLRSSDKIQAYASIAYDQTVRLVSLVDSILVFGRTASLNGDRLETIDMDQLVRASVADFTHSASGRAVQTRVNTRPGRLLVHGDREALEQVIFNLLDNAAKYSGDRETAEVEIDVQRQDAEIVVSVQDNGIGIDPAEADRIFLKFYRGTAPSAGAKGFGIGLTIVRQVMKAHGGWVALDSRPGSGSRFHLHFPAMA